MPDLKLSLFGAPSVAVDGQAVRLGRRKTLGVLIYLALSGPRLQRDALAVLLWPNLTPERSRANLRQEIFVLNSMPGGPWIVGDRHAIALLPQARNGWACDVLQFHQMLAAIATGEKPAEQIEQLQYAAELYHGEFLAGFDLADCSDFEEWQFFQREMLRQEFIGLLGKITAALFGRNEFEKAIPYTLRWLSADALNEAAYRAAMHAHYQAGQLNATMSIYERCRNMLWKELGSAPAFETRAYYREIIQKRPVEKRALAMIEPQLFRPKNPDSFPKTLTSFVGREVEIKVVGSLLTSQRLVTLTGSGGVGKTRLAIRVAENSTDCFPDGRWFVDLSTMTEPEPLAERVATALGMTGISALELIIAFLENKKALMVLDNCEHMVEECARLVNAILTACQGMTCLATSREVLNVPGEVVYRVPSLGVPEDEGVNRTIIEPSQMVEKARGSEAVRLFAERARLVQPEFDISTTNAKTITQVCRRLDGIPLAIELAAARLNFLHLEELQERLEQTFQLISGSSRTALPRWQTLQAAIEWSYGLLSENERRLFRRLAVFSSGCTLEAAEAGCSENGLEEWEILDLLSALVNKSIVIAEQSSGAGLRYRLLEAVRQFALDKLAVAGEEAMMRQRHMDYFVQFCEKAEPHLRNETRLEWMSRLQSELENVRAAIAWAYSDASRATAGLRIAVSFYRFYHIHQMHHEEREWLRQGLELTSEQSIPGVLLAWSWLIYGNISDEAAENKVCLEKCLEISREIGIEAAPVTALALIHLGEYYLYFASVRDENKGLAFITEAVNSARELKTGQRWFLGQVLWQASDILVEHPGSHELAYRLAKESVEVIESTGDRWNRSGLATLGQIEASRGNLKAASQYYTELLRLYQEGDDRLGVRYVCKILGWVNVLRGDLDEAFRLIQSALPYSYPQPQLIGWVLDPMSAILILESQKHPDPQRKLLLRQAAVLRGVIEHTGNIEYDYRSYLMRPTIQQAMDILRASLPPEELRNARTEGYTMTLNQAASFAYGLKI